MHLSGNPNGQSAIGPRMASWLLLLAVYGLFANGLLADVLVTTGGTRYEGQVLDLGGEYQLTNAKGGKMTFPKSMVSRVEKSPTPASKPDSATGGGNCLHG